MNNTLLLQQFDLLATAPGGVARLRELILTLAVQGKLVPQNPADEPASALLKRIRAEKDRLIAEGKIKRDKPLAPIGEDEQPFELPPGWVYCRLGALLLSIRSGGTPSKQNPAFWGGDIPWASVKDLRFGEPVSDTQDRITQAGLCAGSELAPAGSILICTRMGLGKIGEALVDVAINQDLKAVSLGAGIDKQYFINYFKTLAVVGSGMTVAGIKQEELLGFVVPLPPETEQARIVARVEELMRVCDALEATGQRQAAHHRQLVQTLLGDLTADSHTSWQRVADHFDTLLDRPSAVDALEQTILQLAVRGQLVPQDPTDEPASALLKRIRAEKDRLIAAGKIKRDKPLAPIGEEEQPFELPPGWEWVQSFEVCEPSSLITYGILKPVWVVSGIPTVRVQDMKGGVLDTSNLGHCSLERAGKFEKTRLVAGDLLIAKDGATLGKTAFVPPELTGGNVTQHVLRFPINGLLNRNYVRMVIDSEHGQCWMLSETKGVALPGVNVGDFRRLPIPLPPLPEQARIVARVTQLRRLCADLRQRLTQSQTTQAALAEALVVDAVSGVC
ncbi:MAG: restriction endonuclease subunit S [Burkholderiaceae bacterium]|nr:restriction endonuclease subunit S [Burkholderiaceae bacterium]